ncbi:MAG: calcium/sodium antiporter [Polyangiales bacterium]
MNDGLTLLGGALLLYFGAEWFVGAASALARTLRVPPLLVGLTVVAYGTSAPEVMVGVQAARSGHGAVALGNVVGSNIANLGLILGVCALVRPARVHGALRARELPAMGLTALAVPAVLLDGRVSAAEGVALLVAALGYTAWMVVGARRSMLREAARGAEVTADAVESAGAPTARGAWASALVAAAGLGTLLVGGHLFVRSAVLLAQRFGVSERVVGLTVVAVGTSLPELVTGVIASRRGHGDIVVGNVVGSNIFNVLLCLGASALAGAVRADLGAAGLDLGALLLLTALASVAMRAERVISRVEGGVAVGLYVTYLALTAGVGR